VKNSYEVDAEGKAITHVAGAAGCSRPEYWC